MVGERVASEKLQGSAHLVVRALDGEEQAGDGVGGTEPCRCKTGRQDVVAELGSKEPPSKCLASRSYTSPSFAIQGIMLTGSLPRFFMTGAKIYGTHQVCSQRTSSRADRGAEASARGSACC